MAVDLRGVLRPFVWVFGKIAEPRVVRVIQFGIYSLLAIAGGYVVGNPPPAFQAVAGGAGYVAVLGGFLLVGGAVGAGAVLPGIWWLERIGVISLWTGLAIFAVIAAALQVSPVGIAVAVALSLSLVLRWREIRLYQVAPRAR